MSVHPFVRVEEMRSHWTYLREIVHWGFVLNSVDEILVRLKSDKNNTLYKKTYEVLHYFLANYEISRRNTMSRRSRYKHKKYRRVGEAEETVESQNVMWRHIDAG